MQAEITAPLPSGYCRTRTGTHVPLQRGWWDRVCDISGSAPPYGETEAARGVTGLSPVTPRSQKKKKRKKKGLSFFLQNTENPWRGEQGYGGGLPDPCYYTSGAGFGVSPTARPRITAERIPSTAPGLTAPGLQGSLRERVGGKPGLVEMHPQKGGKGMCWDMQDQAVLHPALPIPFCCCSARRRGPGRCGSGSGRAGGGGQQSGRSRARCRGELCLELNAGQASHPLTSPWKPWPRRPAAHPCLIVGHWWPCWPRRAPTTRGRGLGLLKLRRGEGLSPAALPMCTPRGRGAQASSPLAAVQPPGSSPGAVWGAVSGVRQQQDPSTPPPGWAGPSPPALPAQRQSPECSI